MPAPSEKPSAALLGQWRSKLAQMGLSQEQARIVCPVPPNPDDTAKDYADRFTAMARGFTK